MAEYQNTKFLFLTADERESSSHVIRAIFDDFYHMEEVEVFHGLYQIIENPVARLWHKFHTARRVNATFKMPFMSIWNKHLYLYNYQFREDTKYYVIIQNNALTKSFDINFFNQIAKKPNVELIYFTFDPLAAFYSFPEKMWEINFSQKFTYSEEDAKKYQMTLVSTPYSTIFPDLTANSAQNIKRDAVFIGRSTPERMEFLGKLFELLGSDRKNVYFNAYMDKTRFGKTKPLPEVVTPEVLKWNSPSRVDYREALKRTIESNCIIEMSAFEMNTAPTLRYYEAIVYNKKLLTNIQNVSNYPYYNPKYMKVFSSIADITPEVVDWIKTREEIDYGYQGDFSPKELLAKVVSN